MSEEEAESVLARARGVRSTHTPLLSPPFPLSLSLHSRHTFRSIRPGRMSAGSRLSMRLVAMMTFTSPIASKPSI
jgi:hypothetical protein